MHLRRAILAPVLLLPVLLAACGSGSGYGSGAPASAGAATAAASTGSAAVLHEAPGASGQAKLVDARGLTLYDLSVERPGHIICTAAACVAAWHPLLVPAGSQPSGAPSLGTAMRPDGTTQVTWENHPLYTFSGDTSTGQENGGGLRDVGTWTVAALNGSSSAAGSSPAPPAQTQTGGGYRY